MVLAGQEWLQDSRAARLSRNSLTRLLLLSGIVAVAWLAGGMGVAHGEAAPESGGLVDRILEVGDHVEQADQGTAQGLRGTRVLETTDRVASTAEVLADTALHGTGATAALDESGAGDAAGRVVEGTARAIDDTARDAGDLIGGLAGRGHEVVRSADGSLRDGRLVEAVAEGLTDSTRSIHGRIDGAVNTATPLPLPALGAFEEPATEPDRPSVQDDLDTDDREPGEERVVTDSDLAVHLPVDPVVWSSAAAETSVPEADHDSGDRLRLIAGGAHHPAGADAAGASAPSFPAPGAAGFLMARAGHLAPRPQRVALPGDPTLVVRDAADDPSFSPD